jgi:AcrR family transcriptional regulator
VSKLKSTLTSTARKGRYQSAPAHTSGFTPNSSRRYHHGDLHRGIVSAALEVLSESQSTEFSLRELARRAGVSHNAPYKHFADKRELLAAVSAVGFDLLAKRMRNAMEGLSSPRARLLAIARAYVSHGVDNPALYRLMFGGYLTAPDDGRPAIERTAANKTKALLADAITNGALGHAIPNTARNERKIAGAILIFWSQMHGLTLLLVDRLVGPNGKSDELCEIVLQGTLDGLATRIPVLPLGMWVGPRELPK